ncbi:hypothetical protein EBT25_01440 [bacterium]|nr:hypothetical protein [bacterium]
MRKYSLRVNKRNRGVQNPAIIYNLTVVNGRFPLFYKKAAHLEFRIIPGTKMLYIAEGSTNSRYERQGLGAFLRALATKSGKIAGMNQGLQLGQYQRTTNLQHNKPPSTRVLSRLGWKQINFPTNTRNIGNSYRSTLNYKNFNMRPVNNAIRMWKK